MVNVLPGNTCKTPINAWKYRWERAADVQATKQLNMPRRNAEHTGGRDDLETYVRRRKHRPWQNDPPDADYGPPC